MSWVNWSLEGQKSLWEGQCPSLPSQKSTYACVYVCVHACVCASMNLLSYMYQGVACCDNTPQRECLNV